MLRERWACIIRRWYHHGDVFQMRWACIWHCIKNRNFLRKAAEYYLHAFFETWKSTMLKLKIIDFIYFYFSPQFYFWFIFLFLDLKLDISHTLLFFFLLPSYIEITQKNLMKFLVQSIYLIYYTGWSMLLLYLAYPQDHV